MNALGYTRVSTCEQSRDGLSLGLQADKIRAYCDLHDMELAEIVEDAGLSGKSIEGRPGVRRVLDAVRAGATDAVVVWKLDRLARNTIETLVMVEQMEKAGVALHSISESLDTRSAIGRFVVRIMAALAEMERDQISERTKAALAGKKANGGRIGLNAPYGFRLDGDRVVPDGSEQKAVRMARELRAHGLTLRAIADAMARKGYLSRAGTPFHAKAISRMCR